MSCELDKCDNDCILPPYIMRLMDGISDYDQMTMNDLRKVCHAVLSDFRDDLQPVKPRTIGTAADLSGDKDYRKMQGLDSHYHSSPKPNFKCTECGKEMWLMFRHEGRCVECAHKHYADRYSRLNSEDPIPLCAYEVTQRQLEKERIDPLAPRKNRDEYYGDFRNWVATPAMKIGDILVDRNGNKFIATDDLKPKPTYCKSCRSYYYTTHICPVQVKETLRNREADFEAGTVTWIDKKDMGLSHAEIVKKYGIPPPR